MKATIKVKMDNAAFSEGNGAELARILRVLARRIEDNDLSKGDDALLRDYNGNCVGEFKIS